MVIKTNQRLSIIGRTGSGKTTLLKELIRKLAYDTEDWAGFKIVILDTKKDNDFAGIGKKFIRLRELPKLWYNYRVLRYEPIEEEMNEEFYNGFIGGLRKSKRPFTLVIDELSSILGRTGKPPEQYELLMKQGRGKHQVVWAGIQNPVYVPHDFLSNSDHFFIFDLLLEDDRKKMRGIVGDEVMIPPKDMYGFHHFYAGARSLKYYSNTPKVQLVPRVYEVKNEESEVETMNWKYVGGLILLGLAMVIIIPLWKTVFEWIANAIPATRPIADFVAKT